MSITMPEPGSSLHRGNSTPSQWSLKGAASTKSYRANTESSSQIPFFESPRSMNPTLLGDINDNSTEEAGSDETSCSPPESHFGPSEPDEHTRFGMHNSQRGRYTQPHETLSSFAAPRRPLSPSSALSDCSNQSGVPTNAVNYLYVVQKKHSSISGNWTVCPSLPVPWSYYMRSENLRLEASSFVAAKVDVVGDTPCKAFVGVESRHNGVYAEIRNRGNQKFRLRAYAYQDARIRIPRDFAGPVTLYHRHGYASTSYSPAIYSNFRLLDSSEKVTTGWIGTGYEQQGLLGWEGDELIVWSKQGHISLFFGDET